MIAAPRMLRPHITALALSLCAAFGLGCADARVSPEEDARTDAAASDTVARDVGAPDVAPQQDAPDAALPDDSFAPIDALTSDAAVCRADQNGTITRAEVPYVLGASVIYQVNRAGTTVTPVDTVGAAGPAGRVWDFSAVRPEDHRVLDEVIPPTGQWWSSSVSNASFAAWVDRDSDLLGVYRATEGALQLVATVSGAANRTLLTFDPPVDVLRFPLTEGSTWTQSVTGRGYVSFTPIVNLTVYTFRVDARGEVRTPAGRFPALRLRAEIDQSIPGTLIRKTQRSYVFVTECFGVIARLVSVDNETVGEFTRASEYRRLGL